MANFAKEDFESTYDGTVRVPNEIQKIRDPIVFHMTARELIFSACAVAVLGAGWFFLFRMGQIHNSGLFLLPVIPAVPFLCFGFIRPMGMNLEDWITLWISNNIHSAPVRKLFAKNAYEVVMESYQEQQQKIGKQKKATKRKHVKTIYRIRQ